MVPFTPRIVVDPKVRFGRHVIEGTRVPVDVVLARLGTGMSFDEVMSEYGISREDILAVLTYAAKLVSAEEILVTS